jgi:hypothetical protein
VFISIKIIKTHQGPSKRTPLHEAQSAGKNGLRFLPRLFVWPLTMPKGASFANSLFRAALPNVVLSFCGVQTAPDALAGCHARTAAELAGRLRPVFPEDEWVLFPLEVFELPLRRSLRGSWRYVLTHTYTNVVFAMAAVDTGAVEFVGMRTLRADVDGEQRLVAHTCPAFTNGEMRVEKSRSKIVKTVFAMCGAAPSALVICAHVPTNPRARVLSDREKALFEREPERTPAGCDERRRLLLRVFAAAVRADAEERFPDRRWRHILTSAFEVIDPENGTKLARALRGGRPVKAYTGELADAVRAIRHTKSRGQLATAARIGVHVACDDILAASTRDIYIDSVYALLALRYWFPGLHALVRPTALDI